MIHQFVTKAFLCIIAFVALSSADLLYGFFFTPGIKIGCDLSPKSNVTVGIEGSINYFQMAQLPVFTGIVGGVQLNSKNWKLSKYLEGQIGTSPLGFAFGKQWADTCSFTFRMFSGILSWYTLPITNFISFRYLFAIKTSELSAIVKYPYGLYLEYDYGSRYFKLYN
jgi:hypothetical protein